MKRRLEWIRKRRCRIVSLSVLLCLAAFFLWEGSTCREEADCYLRNCTIRAEGAAFDPGWIRETMQLQNDQTEGEKAAKEAGSDPFAAWTELNRETVSVSNGETGVVSDVIVVYGPSHCLLPIGKNLFPEDDQGCILGVELAEELFGGRQAEGQQLFWREKNWMVRGIVEEPSHFLMVQGMQLLDEVSFDRICISLSNQQEGKELGDKWISQYGLSARTVRFDHQYGFGWLTELIPSRWSDFEGWKQNLEEHQKEVELVKNTDKSVIEAVGIDRYNRGLFCSIIGVLCIVFLLWQVVQRHDTWEESK